MKQFIRNIERKKKINIAINKAKFHSTNINGTLTKKKQKIELKRKLQKTNTELIKSSL